MKKILLCLLILFSEKIFSQNDIAYRNLNIFSLSYLNFDSKIKVLDDVSLISIDSNSISFEEVIYGPTSSQNKFLPHTVIFDKINSFGYKVNPSPGTAVGYGALGGFAAGFILGCGVGTIASDGPDPTIPQRMMLGTILGVLGALPGALIGSLTVTDIKEYEKVNISNYSAKKKYEVIQNLIAKGIKKNKNE